MSEDELRAAIIECLRRKGRAQVFEVQMALPARGPEFKEIWERLLQEGEIEVCEGYHPGYYFAKYQLRVQPRLM